MASIADPTLEITNVDDKNVQVIVSYTLKSDNTEQLAGSVFNDVVELLADDSGTQTTIFTYPTGAKPSQFSVSSSAPNVVRSRKQTIPKSTLNEDNGFLANGAEDPDEIFGRITVTYVANQPSGYVPPPPKVTATEKGAWR